MCAPACSPTAPGSSASSPWYSQLFALFMLLVLASAPFVFGGLCIGYLVSKSGERINRLYFFDLLGAGFGSLAALLGINCAGATTTIFGVAAVTSVLAMVIARQEPGRRSSWRYILTAAAATGFVALTLMRDAALPVPFPPSKLVNYHGEDYRWHVIARVDVTPPSEGHPGFGGALSRIWDSSRPPLNCMGIYQDGAAYTGIVDLKGKDPRNVEILGHYMQAAGYVLHPSSKVLVVGPGGGVDVAIALHHGASHVTAVDINPCTISYVRDKYNEFAGGLYRRPDVDVRVAEGRHYLTAVDQQFDVIQLSGVDTFTALASGAYALAENYLYTTEAVSDYLHHLSDAGVVSFSRWLMDPPRETLRLVVTARATLDAQGFEHPEQHFVVIAAPAWEGRSPWAEVLIKKTAFTSQDLDRLRAWARPLKFDIVYDPQVPYVPGGPYDALESTPKYRPSAAAREFSKALRLPPQGLRDYIAGYPYDIRPCTDDRPFFFNYYRWSNLRHPFSASLGGDPVNRLPLGLMILIAALVQIVLLGALFILLPMRNHAAGLRRRGALPVLVYFGAIGLAFISVEIMLLQKFMVFLGGPVYSMAVTLFGLLVFCGMGSFVAKWLTRGRPRIAGSILLLLTAASVVGAAWVLNHEIPRLLGLSMPLRVVVTLLTLLPVGLLMGMPFPTGIRVAAEIHPRFVPWAWCVNACTTVLGSILAVLVAMQTDLTFVLHAGAALYLLAMLALLAVPRMSRAHSVPVIQETAAPAV